MLWFVYNVLFTIGYILLLPRFLLRMRRRGGYRKGFLQRFGMYTPDTVQRLRERPRIWVHAVSVGEIYVAMRFMEELRAGDAETAFVLTTTTSTGHRIAETKLNAADILLYFPSDFPFIINRILDILKPTALILTESELWPNLIRGARSRNIPVILINGRISESSHKGYRLLCVFFGRIVRSIDLLLVQTRQDEQCLLDLGADPGNIKVMGTAKYDIAQFDSAGEKCTRELLETVGFDSDSLIIVGGSTWPGEESILLDVYKRLREAIERLKFVLVPRHAERRAEVEAEIVKRGLRYIRRSEIGGQIGEKGAPEILLVDTTGELKNFYACASVIFVGKSLTSHGGQNIIEAALFGKPIVIGPNMENFPDVTSDFLSANAIIQVQDANGLEQAFRSLLADKDLREAYGRHASEVVRAKKGAVHASIELIFEVIRSARSHTRDS